MCGSVEGLPNIYEEFISTGPKIIIIISSVAQASTEISVQRLF